MAFPNSNLQLSTICDAYGKIPKNLAELTGSVYYTDGTTGGVTTGTTVSLPVSLGNFSSKYISSIGLLADQLTQNSFSGIQGEMGFNTSNYILTNGKLSYLTLNLYVNVSNQGAGINAGYNNQVTQITVGGNLIYSSGNLGIQTFNINPAASGTLIIQVSTNISGSLGQGELSASWTYNINSTGLSGP